MGTSGIRVRLFPDFTVGYLSLEYVHFFFFFDGNSLGYMTLKMWLL